MTSNLSSEQYGHTEHLRLYMSDTINKVQKKAASNDTLKLQKSVKRFGLCIRSLAVKKMKYPGNLTRGKVLSRTAACCTPEALN